MVQGTLSQCWNRLADFAKGIGSFLHLLAVVFNREIALSHGVEVVTQEDGAGAWFAWKWAAMAVQS